MEENEKMINDGEVWWKPVVLFYVKTTSWVVFPLVIAVLLGRYVSRSFGSQSLFFVAVIVGFLITCYGIYREIKDYQKTLNK